MRTILQQSPVRRALSAAVFGLMAATCMSPAALLLHWKLDEPDGTYTEPPGYREEVHDNTSNSLEMGSGTDIVEGEPGLMDDGGTCILMTDTQPGSYLDVGTVQADGTYAAGLGDGTFRVLSGAYTVIACARYTGSGDRVIISSDWNATDGWMLGFRNREIFFDFGNTRRTTGSNSIMDDTTYLIAVRFDGAKTVFGGGVDDYSISFWDGQSWTHSNGTVNRSIRLQGLEIGAFNNGTREMIGMIDDVRIYDHTLSQAELDGLVGGVIPLTLGPVEVTRLAPDEADVTCDVNLDTDALAVYWGTSDPGETTSGWTGSPVSLGAQVAGNVPATLTGLEAGTTYFFRYHGSAAAEEAWSPPGTLTTPLPDPPPRLEPPVTLATHGDGAEVACRLLDADATSTWVVWDTTDQGTPASPPGTWSGSRNLGASLEDELLTHTISGETGDTGYVFRFFAANASGAAWSDPGAFDTGLGDEPAPADLAVDLVDGTNVQLSWVDSYATETGFVLERALDPDFTVEVRSFGVPADVTTYLDGSGAPHTTCHYRVAALNAGGQTPFSEPVTAITGPASPPIPILHWKLDDAGPTFREEISGNTSNSVAINDVTTGLPALAPDRGFSVEMTFDDPGSYIDAGTVQEDGSYVAGPGDGTFLTLGDAYTITAWANYTGLTHGDRVIISSDWDPDTGWMLGFRDGGIFFDFGNTRKTTGAGTVSTDTTYLISVSYDATKTVFGNGIDDYCISIWDGATWSHFTGAVNRSIGLQGLEIGAYNSGTRQIEGRLDDIRIYDKVLNQSDLDALAGMSPGLVLKITHDAPANELTFSWNGAAGRTYKLLANPDLLAAPTTWTAVLSGVTSPQTMARPAASLGFFAVEEMP